MVLLMLTRERHEASRGLSATARIVAIDYSVAMGSPIKDVRISLANFTPPSPLSTFIRIGVTLPPPSVGTSFMGDP